MCLMRTQITEVNSSANVNYGSLQIWFALKVAVTRGENKSRTQIKNFDAVITVLDLHHIPFNRTRIARCLETHTPSFR